MIEPREALKRPRGVVPRPDGDNRKRFPNGVKATFKSIRKYWPNDIRPGPGRNPTAFAKKFRATYNDVARRYGEEIVEEKEIGAFATMLYKLEGSGQSSRGLPFYRLRAFAEFVGLPVALLLIFAQSVSYEAQGRGRAHILRFLAECKRAIASLEDYVNREATGDAFRVQVGDEARSEFQAKLKGLSHMTKTYSRKFVYEGQRREQRRVNDGS